MPQLTQATFHVLANGEQCSGFFPRCHRHWFPEKFGRMGVIRIPGKRRQINPVTQEHCHFSIWRPAHEKPISWLNPVMFPWGS
ncbi:MAG: hypothetical protein WCQ77_03800 [Planctomycetota bacterium]